jgi:hypothetical protein
MIIGQEFWNYSHFVELLTGIFLYILFIFLIRRYEVFWVLGLTDFLVSMSHLLLLFVFHTMSPFIRIRKIWTIWLNRYPLSDFNQAFSPVRFLSVRNQKKIGFIFPPPRKRTQKKKAIPVQITLPTQIYFLHWKFLFHVHMIEPCRVKLKCRVMVECLWRSIWKILSPMVNEVIWNEHLVRFLEGHKMLLILIHFSYSHFKRYYEKTVFNISAKLRAQQWHLEQYAYPHYKILIIVCNSNYCAVWLL